MESPRGGREGGKTGGLDLLQETLGSRERSMVSMPSTTKVPDARRTLIAIKDMAGLLKPRTVPLVTALRNEIGLPIHLHTHDTSGNGVAMLLAAIESGVDAVDCALSSMSGLTSQPSFNALAAALEGSERAPDFTARNLQSLADYWEGVREMYWPFESGLKASTAEVYTHEIPGGQYSNFRPRAIQLGLGHRWDEIKRKYRQVNDALGGLVKVTPTSKVVADSCFWFRTTLKSDCIERADQLDFTIGGRFHGRPTRSTYGGFPEALQRAILGGEQPLTARAGESLADHDFDAAAVRLRDRLQREPSEEALLSDALYPKVFDEYWAFRTEYGQIAHLPTPALLYGLEVGETVLVEIESGKTLVVKLMAVGGLTDEGYRNVYFELNGQAREVAVIDRAASADIETRPKAVAGMPGQIGASMPGKVVSIGATSAISSRQQTPCSWSRR